MTKSPTQIQLKYNWSTPRRGNPIVAIIAHGTVGTDSRTYLSRGGDAPDGSDRKVSIHVLIQKSGTIYRYVPDNLGANHAGFGVMPKPHQGINPNLVTLGFELENLQNGKDPYTDAQLLAMGWQINQWRQLYGPLPILRHADIDPTRRADTVGLSVADMERWAVKAAEYYGAGDPFAGWGNVDKPFGQAADFAIPQAWLKNQEVLGRCIRGERYDINQVSRAMFEGGELRYFGPTNQVELLPYPRKLKE